ncbi:MAG: hypothetical protein AB2606_07115 [Candidatus Thiodiazotropha taylori]
MIEKLTMLTLAFILLGVLGCDTQPVRTGVLSSNNLKIEAIDGSFTIEPGMEFTPPFYTKSHYMSYQNCPADGGMSKQLNKWLSLGAKKIRVLFNDGQTPLYGAITFCHTKHSHYRKYNVVIPESYITRARNGELTAVYEITGNSHGYPQAGWVVWLSQDPL